MQYNPDEYVSKDYSLPEADYAFQVMEAQETVSKNNNDMIELELQIDNNKGGTLTVYDRLMGMPKALWRIKQFCDCTNIDFSAGIITADMCVGRGGIAHLALGKKNDKGKRYMEVQEYMEAEGYTESPSTGNPPPLPTAADDPLADYDDATVPPPSDNDVPF